MGKATAVMSTEPSTGATPASFSAHVKSRNDASGILASQQTTKQNCGTVIRCDFNSYDVQGVKQIQNTINSTLNTLSKDEDGFFLMYEEAHIDKHCHNNDLTNTFHALMRFNQAIGVFMEYAFYHPETFVLITADHETGGLLPNGSGSYSYSHGNHSGHYVPVFAYGMLGEVFDGRVIENTQIPKTIAYMMGEKNFGAKDKYKSLLS
jgi:alkaline phosphatase